MSCLEVAVFAQQILAQVPVICGCVEGEAEVWGQESQALGCPWGPWCPCEWAVWGSAIVCRDSVCKERAKLFDLPKPHPALQPQLVLALEMMDRKKV